MARWEGASQKEARSFRALLIMVKGLNVSLSVKSDRNSEMNKKANVYCA